MPLPSAILENIQRLKEDVFNFTGEQEYYLDSCKQLLRACDVARNYLYDHGEISEANTYYKLGATVLENIDRLEPEPPIPPLTKRDIDVFF